MFYIIEKQSVGEVKENTIKPMNCQRHVTAATQAIWIIDLWKTESHHEAQSAVDDIFRTDKDSVYINHSAF